MPSFSVSSAAARSAPVRAERKTGLVELFAIMAIVILLFDPACVAVFGAAESVLAAPPPLQATMVIDAMATEILRRCFVMSVLSGRVFATFVNFKMAADFMNSTRCPANRGCLRKAARRQSTAPLTD